jgi:hypothetical protein
MTIMQSLDTTTATDTVPGVEIRVSRHYEGPPGMTNGGWACGLVAGLLTGPDTPRGTAVEVTLRAPVPLETPVYGECSGNGAFLFVGSEASVGDSAFPADGGDDRTVLAMARLLTSDEAAALPPPPGFEPLAAAERAGAPEVCVQTPFQTCYVCGHEREGGLRVAVGAVAMGDIGRVAGVWTPPSTLGDLPLRYLWAALDCPTGLVHLTDGGTALLGRLTMTAHRAPVAGEPLVVVAAATGVDRRKRFSTAALYTPAGDLVANSVAVWLAI